jgi:large subunit ribosomal protein L23
LRRYAFRVDKKANKLEIKRAVQNFYGVTVVDVNTVVAPAKSKTRYTKGRFYMLVKNHLIKKHL